MSKSYWQQSKHTKLCNQNCNTNIAVISFISTSGKCQFLETETVWSFFDLISRRFMYIFRCCRQTWSLFLLANLFGEFNLLSLFIQMNRNLERYSCGENKKKSVLVRAIVMQPFNNSTSHQQSISQLHQLLNDVPNHNQRFPTKSM